MHKPFYGLCALACALINTTFAAEAIHFKQQPLSLLSEQPLLKKTSSDIDFNQTTNVRYQQQYFGYPVWGADIVIHIPRGSKENINALFLRKQQSNITANGVIYQHLDADLKNTTVEQPNKIKQQAIDDYIKSVGSSNLISQKELKKIVYVDQHQQAHWAYLLTFLSTPTQGIPAKPSYILDATTLEIYQKWDNIQTLTDTLGGGFGGNEKIGKISYDSKNTNYPALNIQRDDSQKICYLENPDVIVRNANHNNIINFSCIKPDYSHGNIYWNANHDACNGAYSPSNDALFVGKIVKDMYQQWYKIPVLTLNGKPMQLNMQVHLKIDNAYWDGYQMTFGDGVELFYPLVTLGVAAHEISHGFTQQHSNLIYFGQSGGINESFSDMASQAASFYLTQHNNWTIGDDIVKTKNKALRYMDEPTKDCVDKPSGGECSISNANDYTPGIDVHHSSGVFNKFFYLISTAKGWDTHKAFNIMVHANQHYWTSTSDFIDAACGVIQAAKDYRYPVSVIKQAAEQVGIDVGRC